ncbi:MAG: PH domain-containing protein [Alteraurantiacibacter sp.]
MLDDDLTPLDPKYRTVMRLEGVLSLIPFLIASGALGFVEWVPRWVPGVLMLAAAILLVGILPSRRFRVRGYDMAPDRLRVVKGMLFHSDTVVPFSRVQHLDVEQGPLERMFGIARLILHTAGTHNASVTLPGLAHGDAVAMREEIRQHVKRESM